MFCTKCGANNEDNNAFCKNCGAKLITNSTDTQSVASNSGVAHVSNSMKIMMIAGVAIIFVFIVGGLLFWRKGSNSKVDSTAAVPKGDTASALSYEVSNQIPSKQILEESNVISDNSINTYSSDISYVPGIYSRSLVLGNDSVEIQITVNKDRISSINLTNVDESIVTLYPLLFPTLNELSETIISQQSIENISYNDENSYISMLLMQAISETLSLAQVDGENNEKGNSQITVLGEDQQPAALKEIIAEKSAQPFQISYTIGEELYIAMGYGEQPSGGYSICVNEVYETKDAMVIDTTLISPDKAQNVIYEPTRPYIVIETENIGDKKIEFK